AARSRTGVIHPSQAPAADARNPSRLEILRRASTNLYGALPPPVPEQDLGAKVGANMHSHRATSGDVQPAPSQVNGTPGRHCATSGGWLELIWEQEAAGSNPAIPTKGAGYRS